MFPRIAGAVATLALLASCAPDPKAPVKVVVLVYDYAGRYQPQTVELTTPTDLVALGGPVARIVGGASFDLSAKGLAGVPANATLQQVLKAATKDEGSAVRVSYLEKGGVLVPADFHSLNIATTYYNFERAFAFFQSIGGLAVESFGTPTVYYFPRLIEDTTVPEKDNAVFASLFSGFLILPFDQFQQVPLAINTGVIGHEYSHAVFNYRVFSKSMSPFPYFEWDNGDLEASPGLNLLRSLDEGIADTFGTGITCSKDLATCDAMFFGESLPLDKAQDRCLEGLGCKLHCLTDTLIHSPWKDLTVALASADATSFAESGYQYQVGSVLAGALWRAASDEDVTAELTAGGARRAMFTTLYKALAGGASGSGGLRELAQAARTDQTRFRLDSSDGDRGVLDAIVASSVNATLKTALCRAFLDRFNLTASAIPSCAGQTAFTECSGAR